MPGAFERCHGCPELDPDALNQILFRLVDVGSAQHLSVCSVVCRLWYAGALSDELWSRLLLRKWGAAAILHGRDYEGMTYKSKYVRAATTRVHVWGQRAVMGNANGSGCFRSLIGVRTISAGAGFSCAVTWDGRAVCWGNNASAQCGLPAETAAFVAEPTFVQLPASCSAVAEMACGLEHVGCICVSSECPGALLCWGSNRRGQLGESGTFMADLTCSVTQEGCMVLHKLAAELSSLACGSHHTVAIANGTVFAWGKGCDGQCGRDNTDTTDARRSRAVEGLEGVEAKEVAAGANFTLAVTPHGTCVFLKTRCVLHVIVVKL